MIYLLQEFRYDTVYRPRIKYNSVYLNEHLFIGGVVKIGNLWGLRLGFAEDSSSISIISS